MPELCPRFTARVFEDVTIGESPPWLKARLMAAGQRPISNVVDITNYVMLLTGQPLHAFDLDRVAGQRLVVRAAREGETIDTLDGQTRTLEAGEIVIDDADGPTSLAGVMGGARSEVADDTTRVLMEVASWHAPTIQRTSTRLGAALARRAARFEKGLSTGQTMEAQAVATQLMVELCGARVVAGHDRRRRPGPRTRRRARAAPRARRARCSASRSPRERQAEILALARVRRDATATTALRRRASRTSAPATSPARPTSSRRSRGSTASTSCPRRCRRAAARPGRLTPRAARAAAAPRTCSSAAALHEVVGWSFTEPSVADRLRLPADDPRRRVRADRQPDERGPVAPAHDAARLAARRRAAQPRARRGRPRALRERRDLPRRRARRRRRARSRPTATRSRRRSTHEPGPAARAPRARRRCSSAASRPRRGAAATRRRGTSSRPRALVGAVLDTLRVEWDVRAGEPHPFLHPGRSARVYAGETELGWLGEVHPLVARAWDLEGPVAAFELDLGLVDRAGARRARTTAT